MSPVGAIGFTQNSDNKQYHIISVVERDTYTIYHFTLASNTARIFHVQRFPWRFFYEVNM